MIWLSPCPEGGPVSHLYTLDLGAAHASAAIHQKQQLSGGFVKLWRFAQQVGTEVQHQHGAAQDVLVLSLPHKLQLQEADRNTSVSDWRTCWFDIPGEGAPTFFSGSESFRAQRMKSLREEICSSYWPNENLPLSNMTNGLWASVDNNMPSKKWDQHKWEMKRSPAAHRWDAEWFRCVCRMDAPVPRWCRWQRHSGRWGLHLPSEHGWDSPDLKPV